MASIIPLLTLFSLLGQHAGPVDQFAPVDSMSSLTHILLFFPLIAAISFVYAASRFETQKDVISRSFIAIRWIVFISGFVLIVVIFFNWLM